MLKNPMEQWHYACAGLLVRSQLEVPEWAGFELTPAPVNVDVVITLDDESANNDNQPVIRADEFRFAVPEVGSYWVREGREIRVSPAPGAGWREVRLYLLGSAWGALCYQRDLLVLHASAVKVEAGAVVFCADPGMGKSTLAAWLTTQGHALVSDDMTRFDVPTQGQPVIYPSAPRLKLWQDALDTLEWNSPNLERDHYRYDKFHLPLNGNGTRHPLPLRAIYVLEWGDLELSRLNGQAALRRFISAATYRGALLEPMGKMGAYWRQCLELVSRVPVWELKRPRDWSTMKATMNLLMAHWQDELKKIV